MENKPQQLSVNLKISKFILKYTELYLDIGIRSIFAFLISILVSSIARVYFRFSLLTSLAITFILMIAITPIFSKVRLSRFLLNYIDNYTNKLSKKWMK